ncbi:MAG: hypothetical protein EA379_07735 [Phycisphaerales bacterium]|nr:MAG: hypothetical protein EA379_07735 [Phycisphaerales bacterium]
MSSTLMDRARALMSTGKTALAVAPLAVAGANAYAATFTVTDIVWGFPSGGQFDGGGFQADAFKNGAGVKMHGTTGTITGDEWESLSAFGFEVLAFGSMSGPIKAGDFLAMTYDIEIDVTDGEIEWTVGAAVNPGGDNARFLSHMAENGSGVFIDTLLAEPWSSDIDANGFWSFGVAFNWTGFTTSSELTFTIPPNSIDILIVPTPGALALLGIAGLIALRRRR